MLYILCIGLWLYAIAVLKARSVYLIDKIAGQAYVTAICITIAAWAATKYLP
jgi:hypothetical protein